MPTTLEEKRRKWANPNEQQKFVIHGGKIMCTFCTIPIADLIVTSSTIMMQDKPWASVADKNGKINFNFTGFCNHPSQQKLFMPPPLCKAIINLGEWQDFSDVMVGDNNALLVRSTIPCMISGQDLKIVDSGQRARLERVKPTRSDFDPDFPTSESIASKMRRMEMNMLNTFGKNTATEKEEDTKNEEDTFIPVVELDKSYPEDGFVYEESTQTHRLSHPIERRDYILNKIFFMGKEDITLKFNVIKGNSNSNEGSAGNIEFEGVGVEVRAESAMDNLSYRSSFLLKISSRRLNSGAYINFRTGNRSQLADCIHCGKVMIFKNTWHEPVDNPQINKYNSLGDVRPQSATFGDVRRNTDGTKRFHSGLDLFALPETKVYGDFNIPTRGIFCNNIDSGDSQIKNGIINVLNKCGTFLIVR